MAPFTSSIETGCVHWHPYKCSIVTNPRSKRLFTDTKLHNPELREEMEEFYHYLQKILRYEGLIIPSNNYDLVLDIELTEDGRIQWSYYYACHETRCLFWLDVYVANHMISEVFWVTSPAHVSASHLQVRLRTR